MKVEQRIIKAVREAGERWARKIGGPLPGDSDLANAWRIVDDIEPRS